MEDVEGPECPICLEPFVDRVRLNCGHHYCLKCIRCHFKVSAGSSEDAPLNLRRVIHIDEREGFYYARDRDGEIVMGTNIDSLRKKFAFCCLCRTKITSWSRVSQPDKPVPKTHDVIVIDDTDRPVEAQPEQILTIDESQPLREISLQRTPTPTNDPNSQLSPDRQPSTSDHSVRPSRITGNDGRGRHIKYTIEWSDGTSSSHPKEFLNRTCPDLLYRYQLNNRAANTARWRCKKTGTRT